MKEWMRKKSVRAVVVVSGVVGALAPAALAADDASSTITTAFTSGFQQMASDAVGMIAIIVPIALGVAGTVFLVKKAMGWFKSIAK